MVLRKMAENFHAAFPPYSGLRLIYCISFNSTVYTLLSESLTARHLLCAPHIMSV